MLIEGVGDDVLVLVILFIIVLILTLAWISTGVSERPFVGIVVLDRHRFDNLIRRIRQSGVTLLGPDGSLTTSERTNDEASSAEPTPAIAASTNEENTDTASPEGEENNDVVNEESSRTIPTPTDVNPPIQEPSASFIETSNTSVNECDSRSEPVKPSVLGLTELRHRRLTHLQTDSSVIQSDNVSEDNVTRSNLETQASQNAVEHDRPEIPTPSQGDNESESSAPEEGTINIRIKYLDERQKLVRAMPDDTIGQFKRRFFGAELAENMIIRFIYNGQELRQENSTLQSYNIGDNSVIHCLLSQGRPNVPSENQAVGLDFDMGTLMFPLFGLILALIWYCRFCYRVYFNTISTFALVGITFLFLVAVMATWRNPGNQEQNEVS